MNSRGSRSRHVMSEQTKGGPEMLLQHRTAIVHGGSGDIGSAVAQAYAREGAEVHLTGRRQDPLDEVAHRISSAGGVAHVAVLDVVDRDAVDRHAAAVADRGGGIDVCFDATFNDDIQGTPLAEMPVGDVMQPVAKAVTSTFNVATACCCLGVPASTTSRTPPSTPPSTPPPTGPRPRLRPRSTSPGAWPSTDPAGQLSRFEGTTQDVIRTVLPLALSG